MYNITYNKMNQHTFHNKIYLIPHILTSAFISSQLTSLQLQFPICIRLFSSGSVSQVLELYISLDVHNLSFLHMVYFLHPIFARSILFHLVSVKHTVLGSFSFVQSSNLNFLDNSHVLC